MYIGSKMSYPARFSLLFLTLLPLVDAQTFLGGFTGYTVRGKAITVRADTASVRFIFYKPEVLRVDFLPSPTTVLDSSFVVIQDTVENVVVFILETDSTFQVSSSAIRILCQKNPLRISFYNGSGQLLLAEPASGGLATNQAERWAVFSLTPDDHLYGTGERGTSLDKRGQAFDSYNTQIGGYTSPLPTMNINVPFLASTRGYALYFENNYRARFDLGASDPTRLVCKAVGGELSCYLIAMPKIPDQLERYTWLTGRQPLPPRWALGFIQSKYGYHNETEAYALVDTMRQKQIPCDALVLDLYWFSQMGDISWDLSAFPNPFQMMTDFLAQGIKTIVITEPYITSRSINYSTAFSNGYLGRNPQGQPYVLQNWWSCGCDAGLLDLTNPEVQDWWWSKHPSFFGSQLAGIWTDLGEPERHPDDMLHYLGPTVKVHNIFNLLWAKKLFEGFAQLRPNQRIFNLTRSGYAGIQRYGVIPWSSDVGKAFGGLAVQLPMLLNMGMSGLAYHNSDIGGFCCGTTTPELYIRWMQYGTFCPIARAHGTGQPTEPWGYGDQAEDICRSFIQLRYRLLPYIYTMAYKNFTTGLPLARPLFFDYPGDENLFNESSSYLWGDAFLVSPVVQASQTSKRIYLPQGVWIDYWTDSVFQGGPNVVVTTPLETMPLFVKAGSIIPMAPVMNYSDERPLDTLMLVMYPQRGKESRFSLYEDDGKTLAYQSGSFAQTLIVQNSGGPGSSSLTIDIYPTVGMYTGRPERRVYLSEIHGIANNPTAVWKKGQPVPRRFSYQELRENGDGFYYDTLRQRLLIHTPTVPDSSYRLEAENAFLMGVISEQSALASSYKLAQNYPNPFNPSTTIEFSLPRSSYVTLKVFSLLGEKIATLADNDFAAGSYRVDWNAKSVASGVYLYRLVAGSFVETKKMLLLR
jgi:alpha-glucosidase (family GH31 glycosyl hydrolase)